MALKKLLEGFYTKINREETTYIQIKKKSLDKMNSKGLLKAFFNPKRQFFLTYFFIQTIKILLKFLHAQLI